MSIEPRKHRAARRSLVYNLAATAVKLAAAIVTGSVSLMGEAVHSSTDIVASLMAYFSVRASANPPDDDHPYGHGKMESVAGFGESVMLLLIVGYIVYEAVTRLTNRAPQVHNVEIGTYVMLGSAVTAWLVGLNVLKVGRETESLALQSNGQHLLVDAWTSAGVLVALVITQITGYAYADAIAALILAAFLGRNAWRMFCEAFDHLVDKRIADEEMDRLREILDSEPDMISYHRLRTRHSGSTHYVDVHIVVPREWTVVRAHALADSLEKRIQEALNPAVAVIHVDPYDPDRDGVYPAT